MGQQKHIHREEICAEPEAYNHAEQEHNDHEKVRASFLHEFELTLLRTGEVISLTAIGRTRGEAEKMLREINLVGTDLVKTWRLK